MIFNDNIKYNVKNGNVVLIHESNWDYTKRKGSPYLAIVIWHDVNGQPLCIRYNDIKRGIYNPFWSDYRDIVSIIEDVDLGDTLMKNLCEPIKSKEYYISKYKEKWKECLILAKTDDMNSDDNEQATILFDEIANAEAVVGFYLEFHKDNAYKNWLKNTEGVVLSEQSTTVDFILKNLFKTTN